MLLAIFTTMTAKIPSLSRESFPMTYATACVQPHARKVRNWALKSVLQ